MATNPPRGESEARQYPRLAFRTNVRVWNWGGALLRAVDLSAGGLGAYSDRPMGAGQLVHLALLNQCVRVEGTVRHERESPGLGWRIGIQFREMQPELLAVAVSCTSEAE